MSAPNIRKKVLKPVTSKWLCGLVAVVFLAGCGKVPPITEADLRVASLADVPAWNPAWAGTPFGESVGAGGAVSCHGFVDLVGPSDDGTGSRIEGWAWDVSASKPFPAVIVTDADGAVRGAGVTMTVRKDVSAAMPSIVKDDRVGFLAFADAPPEGLIVYGYDGSGDTYCRLSAN